MARRYQGPELRALAEEFLDDPEIGDNAAAALQPQRLRVGTDDFGVPQLRQLP